jgi:predicted enzyme related to lactoylglutathione lyase
VQEEPAMNLNSIMIGTEDAPRLAEFYTRLFGEPAWSDDSYTGWQLGSGFMFVGAHDQVKGRNAHPGRILWNLESDDVPGDFARLTAAGAIVVEEPYHPGGETAGWIATLADPDDNYFQLMSPMEP